MLSGEDRVGNCQAKGMIRFGDRPARPTEMIYKSSVVRSTNGALLDATDLGEAERPWRRCDDQTA